MPNHLPDIIGYMSRDPLDADPAFTDGVLQPFHVEDDPEPEEIPLAEHFFSELPRGRYRGVSREYPIATERCRFDSAGHHLTMAEHCPHFDSHDEMGKRITPGWTVQGG